MQFRRSPETRAIDRGYHRGRQRARENYFSIEQASPVEIVKYELEAEDITGKENPRTYTWNRAIDLLGINGTDVRNLEDR